MSALNQTEIEKLSCMYDGDKARDASSKIRGFLFQDYVAIDRLLQPGVEYVCSEYLEDVDAFYENGTFEFIQVKYYPKKKADMKEISTDLYYQYLRLQMLHSGLNAEPYLYIHTQKPVKKPESDDMKEYMGFAAEKKSQKGKSKKDADKAEEVPKPKLPADVPDRTDPAGWLSSQVHVLKKEEQKTALFRAMASEKTLDAFVNKLKVIPQNDIVTYKENLLKALGNAYENPDPEGDEEHWQMILLGLAVSYIQRRYMLTDPDFAELRVDKGEFDRYMAESSRTRTEQSIASYLVAAASEEYETIVKRNDLSDLQLDMLNRIYKKTIQWIGQIGATPAGQYQLLNTFSTDEASEIAAFQSKDIDGRLRCMAECKGEYHVFLDYLWKIMLNLCQNQIKTEKEMDRHSELFDPKHYIVSEVTDYVCLNFPEDKYVNHSVILPRAGRKFKGVKRKLVERMVKMSTLPRKWFFENDSLAPGKNYFYFSTADVNESPSVTDLEKDCFYIECMSCIRIDEGDWSEQDPCGNCIFSEKCAEEDT